MFGITPEGMAHYVAMQQLKRLAEHWSTQTAQQLSDYWYSVWGELQ